MLELLPGGLGAGKLISAQPRPGDRGVITSFSHPADAQVNKQTHKSTQLLEFWGAELPQKAEFTGSAALSSRGDTLLPSDKVRGCPKTTLPAP